MNPVSLACTSLECGCVMAIFELSFLKDDPLVGLQAFHAPQKKDYARLGIIFLMAHKERHHSSEGGQRLSFGRWRNGEFVKDKLKTLLD